MGLREATKAHLAHKLKSAVHWNVTSNNVIGGPLLWLMIASHLVDTMEEFFEAREIEQRAKRDPYWQQGEGI